MATDRTFIETQFPIFALSQECELERKKGTLLNKLAHMGPWWENRIPIVLIRAAILGLIMPASENSKEDLDIFLKTLVMDEAGLWWRKNRNIPLRELYDLMTPCERVEFFGWDTDPEHPRLKKKLGRDMKEHAQALAFRRMRYDTKLAYCSVLTECPSEEAWQDINAHFGTHANSIPDLITQLGNSSFGRVPTIGDPFCGDGTILLEAAQLGCPVSGSDNHPISTLVTWSKLQLIAGGGEAVSSVYKMQQSLFNEVDHQITEWGIEHNEVGWRADYYLYCKEIHCPECHWRIPLASSWVVCDKTRTLVKLVLDAHSQRCDLPLYQGADSDAIRKAKQAGTIRHSKVICPHCNRTTSFDSIEKNIVKWKTEQISASQEDVLQERLYAIRWILPELHDLLNQEQRLRQKGSSPEWLELIERMIHALMPFLTLEEQREVSELRARDWWIEDSELATAMSEWEVAANDAVAEKTQIKMLRDKAKALNENMMHRCQRLTDLSDRLPQYWYQAPTYEDVQREAKVIALLKERFGEWKEKGYIPCQPLSIRKGKKGETYPKHWTYWHHAFSPRQLLIHGLFYSSLEEFVHSYQDKEAEHFPLMVGMSVLALVRCVAYNGKLPKGTAFSQDNLSRYAYFPHADMDHHSAKGLLKMSDVWFSELQEEEIEKFSFCGHYPISVNTVDPSVIPYRADIWVTSPFNSEVEHSLSEYLLAWCHTAFYFPDWWGSFGSTAPFGGVCPEFLSTFNKICQHLGSKMPEKGVQLIFTSQEEIGTWSDVVSMLWATGLRLTTMWRVRAGLISTKKSRDILCVILRKRSLSKQESSCYSDSDFLVKEVTYRVEQSIRYHTASKNHALLKENELDTRFVTYVAILQVLTDYPGIEWFSSSSVPPLQQEGTSVLADFIEDTVNKVFSYRKVCM